MNPSENSQMDVIKFTQNRKYRKTGGEERTYEQVISCDRGESTCTVTEDDDGDKSTREVTQEELLKILLEILQGEVGRMFKRHIPMPIMQKAIQGPDIPPEEKFNLLFRDPETKQSKVPNIPKDLSFFLHPQIEPSVMDDSDDESDESSRCPFKEAMSRGIRNGNQLKHMGQAPNPMESPGRNPLEALGAMGQGQNPMGSPGRNPLEALGAMGQGQNPMGSPGRNPLEALGAMGQGQNPMGAPGRNPLEALGAMGQGQNPMGAPGRNPLEALGAMGQGQNPMGAPGRNPLEALGCHGTRPESNGGAR